MSEQLRFKPRRNRRNPKANRRVASAFQPVAAGAGSAQVEFPGIVVREPESSRRTWVTGSAAALLHGSILGLLFLLAALAPEIVEEIIPVQLLKEELAPEPDRPAPAPKALQERRLPNFAPQVQTVAPQIVNPRVIANASPAVDASVLQMDAVSSVRAPTQINRSSAPVVERVSVVNSPISARASTVDVQGLGGPAVRGPVKLDAPVGASVGPRKVNVASTGPSIGTGKLEIGGDGSSVREGKITGRDVVGSPTGAPLVSIDTAVGDGLLRGSGGDGGSLRRGAGAVTGSQCINMNPVRNYLQEVEKRTYDRWVLPPGIDPDQRVRLRFRLDVAGSAVSVAVVESSHNALGASAVDALRAAAPFPPMPEDVKCLAGLAITATFENKKKGT